MAVIKVNIMEIERVYGFLNIPVFVILKCVAKIKLIDINVALSLINHHSDKKQVSHSLYFSIYILNINYDQS